MPVTTKVYSHFTATIMGGELVGDAFKFDWLSDTCKVALFTSTHVPSQADDYRYGDLANEVTNGAGYLTGGAVLPTPTVTLGALATKYDADDVVWAGLTKADIKYAVVYDDTMAGDPLICYVDFGATLSLVAGTLTITWAATGVLTITTT